MNQDILEALQIMLIGMSVVIIFLVVLVFVMKFISVIIEQLESLENNNLSTNNIEKNNINNDDNNKKIAIAIALAHLNKDK